MNHKSHHYLIICCSRVSHSASQELSFSSSCDSTHDQEPSFYFPSPPSTSHSYLRVAHLNYRNLLAHLDDVLLFIQSHSIIIMTLSETWLDDTVSDLEVCPPHYGLSIVRRDRNRRGGAVAIMFSNHVRYRLCFDLSEGNVIIVGGIVSQ